MKQYLPYNVLLFVSVALTGLMVFYNTALRDTFAVTVSYTMPAVPPPEPVATEQFSPGDETGGDESGEAYEWVDYDQGSYQDENILTSVTFPLDINRATHAELLFIPQVGDVTAQRIIQYRDTLGGYTSLEQLKDIKGIAGATFDKIAAYLIIEQDETAQSTEAVAGEADE